MAFNTYEELQAAVKKRREAILTLEVDLGTDYSPEWEAAKKELAEAKAMKMALGGASFLGDNLEELEARVAALKPTPNSVWLQYSKLDLGEWSALIKRTNLSPLEQYEQILPKTFVGLYLQDPSPDEEDKPEDWVAPEPVATSGAVASSRGIEGILPGPLLNNVVLSFMAWQNSSGEVSIRPTKSGRD